MSRVASGRKTLAATPGCVEHGRGKQLADLLVIVNTNGGTIPEVC
jgi:hypothetical protein